MPVPIGAALGPLVCRPRACQGSKNPERAAIRVLQRSRHDFGFSPCAIAKKAMIRPKLQNNMSIMTSTSKIVKVTPIYDGFAAEISGLDLSKPIPDDIFEALHAAIDEAGVVMFRDQVLSDVGLVEFSERLGSTGTAPQVRPVWRGPRERVTMLANVDDEGNLIKLSDKHGIYMKGNLLWHSDSSYKPVPCTYSVLSAKEVPPEGGETEFADMRACYDDWEGPFGDIEKEELEDLVCEHSIIYSRSLISGDIFSPTRRKRKWPRCASPWCAPTPEPAARFTTWEAIARTLRVGQWKKAGRWCASSAAFAFGPTTSIRTVGAPMTL